VTGTFYNLTDSFCDNMRIPCLILDDGIYTVTYQLALEYQCGLQVL
jgi:hypothetical protein